MRLGEILDMNCRCCGARDVELFLDLGDQPHCNRLIPPALAGSVEPRFPLRAGFCRRCTMVQIDHTIPKESMFSNYPYVSGTTKTLPSHFAATSRRLLENYGFTSDSLVVDIGSNDGTWLKQYQPFGLRVLGIEPAANVAEIANAAGINTWNRFFNEETAGLIQQEYGKADLVTAAGVFFHLEELHSVCDGVKNLLSENGVFCVQAIYLGGMIENTAFDQIYHEHLCYYTLLSLQNLLRPHGLEVFSVSIVSVHGGSLEAHVGHIGHRPIQASVVDMLADEKAMGLDDIETYRRFADCVWRLRDDLLALLSRYRTDGKSVYCYGAPAKGATLLNSFGVGPDLVELAIEKSPLKFDHLIPGVRIPIVDETVVGRPDAYLVLSWNFLDEFLQKERSYLEAGGEFIVPVPALRILTKAQLAAPAGAWTMSVVVFGATGFVGRNLVIALADAGHDVIAVSRSGASVNGATTSLPIDRLAELPPLAENSVCFHVAAQRYDATRFDMAQSDILTANVELTNRVFAFCAERGIKEVRLASSVAVYQAGLPVMNDAHPVELNAPPNANEAFYAWSKRWAEILADLYARRYGISTVAFRLSNPYGPMDSTDTKAAHVLPAFILRALDDGPIFSMRGDPYVERDFVWVGDVADVFLRSLAWRGRSETYNLCTGETVTLLSLAETILRLAGATKTIALESNFAPAAVRVRRSSADRLREAFGIGRFTPLDTGLATTIAWYKEALADA